MKKGSMLLMKKTSRQYLRDYLGLFSIAGAIIALDQWTKHLVRTNLVEGVPWMPWEWLEPYARLIYIHNTGAAFGIMQAWGWVFLAFALLVAGLIVYFYPRTEISDWSLRLALCLQMGGTVGNLIDRITRGLKVTDFISVGNFAIFNVADSAISISIAVLLIGALIKARADKKKIIPDTTGMVDQVVPGEKIQGDDAKNERTD
jgi:signal peptidase II